MRPQLTQLEQIESYVLGTLNAADLSTFEQALANSPELGAIVEFQRLAIQAAKRQALRKEIALIANSGSTGFTKKWMWIFIAVLATTLVAATIYLNIPESQKETHEPVIEQAPVEETEEVETIQNNDPIDSVSVEEALLEDIELEEDKNDALGRNVEPEVIQTTNSAPLIASSSVGQIRSNFPHELNPWVPFEEQIFNVNAKDGATLEGKDGSLVIIPSDAFLDNEGTLISGYLQVELVEAIKWEDMLAYNLTTTSDGKALSSGGMLYIQPYQNGETVQLNPDRPIYIEIPTDNYDPNMMAWEGEVVDGDINWKSPTPLKKFLTKVNLNLLDFIPEGFADEVEAGLPFRNHISISKALVDSLYYSLGRLSDSPEVSEISGEKAPMEFPIKVSQKDVLIKGSKRQKRRARKDPPIEFAEGTQACCYIEPLSIKTIRAAKFQNTFIATKEFEERLQAMHNLENGQGILDVYLSNLDKDMRVSDEIAVEMVEGKDKEAFRSFVNQNATNVDATIYQEQLTAFYNRKRKEYSTQLERTRTSQRNKTTAELNRLKNELTSMTQPTAQNPGKTSGKTSKRSRTGIAPPIRRNVTNMKTYATTWYKAGWVNIDSYLHLLDKGRPREITVTIEDQKASAKIYQCIDVLKTIIPLETVNNEAVAKFPNRKVEQSKLMENTYCLAIAKEKDGIYYSERRYNPYATDHVYLTWEKISQKELVKRLSQLSPNNSALIKSMKEEEERIERQLAIIKKQEEIQKERARLSVIQEKENAFKQQLIDFLDQCNGTTEAITGPEIIASVLLTPDGNGKDDFYFMRHGKASFSAFTVVIRDQKGVVVYKTDNPNFRWDGENLLGLQCSEGIYICEYSYQKNGAKTITNGTERINLQRNGPDF